MNMLNVRYLTIEEPNFELKSTQITADNRDQWPIEIFYSGIEPMPVHGHSFQYHSNTVLLITIIIIISFLKNPYATDFT